MSVEIKSITLSNKVVVKTANILNAGERAIQIQINGIDDGIATASPYNICIVNTNGLEVGNVTDGNLAALLNLQI